LSTKQGNAVPINHRKRK